MKKKESLSLEKVLIRLIRLHLFLPLLLVIIIAICTAGYLGERIIEEQQYKMASNQARLVDVYLDQASRVLNAVVRVAEVSQPEYINTCLNGTWEGYGFFDTLYYLDDHRRILQIVPENPRYLGLTFSGLPVLDTFNNTTPQVISRPFISFRTGKPTIYLVRPLSHSNGFIIGELNLQTLQQETILAMGKEMRDFVFILDQSGMLLTHPHEELVRQQTNLGNLEIFHQGFLKDSTIIYPYEGSWVLGSSAKVNNTEWIVIDQIPLLVAFTPYLYTLGLTLIVALILWLTLMWTIRRELDHLFITPLVTLSNFISSVRKGDYLQDISLTTNQYTFAELTKLAQDFQNMSHAIYSRKMALKKSEEELITYRDHLEELVKERTSELAIAMEEAKAADRAKSVFVSTMSHELRTPLNAILGYTQIFLKRQIGEEFESGLKTIQKSGEHLLTLINDILDLAKIEARKVELFPGTTNFPAFIDGIISIVQVRAKAKGLSLINEIPQPLPAYVQVDETRMRQVLLNILGNAVKFTDQGHVIFRTIVLDNKGLDNSDTAQIRFEIEDTGIGIPKDKQNLLFIPFEQIGDSFHRNQGTGLGLAISHQLVRLMGGDIHVVSEPGKGSTFWFDITVPTDYDVVPMREELYQEIIGYSGERKRILVADDIKSNRDVVVDLLQPLGFEMIQADNGLEAVQIAGEIKPHLIIMDLKMPVQDGYASIEEIRKNQEISEVPIIAYSANVSETEQEHARMAGFNDFILKPLSWSNLSQIIQKYLHISWEYQEKVPTDIEINTDRTLEKTKIIPPPQDMLQKILNLTERGDVLGVVDLAGSIENLGCNYQPFARKLRNLAEGYEMNEIHSFVRNFLHEEKP